MFTSCNVEPNADRRKYVMTDKTMELSDGVKVYQIEAVKDFTLIDGTEIHTGDLGGYIECEENLSHEGCCWVGENAVVRNLVLSKGAGGGNTGEGNSRNTNGAQGSVSISIPEKVVYSRVYGDAYVTLHAEVRDGAQVYGNALVFNSAIVIENSKVHGEACVYDNAVIKNGSEVCGNAFVFNDVTADGVKLSGTDRFSTDEILNRQAEGEFSLPFSMSNQKIWMRISKTPADLLTDEQKELSFWVGNTDNFDPVDGSEEYKKIMDFYNKANMLWLNPQRLPKNLLLHVLKAAKENLRLSCKNDPGDPKEYSLICGL